MPTIEEIVAKRMAGKTPAGNNTYIKNGKGRLIVKNLRLTQTREAGLAFIANFQVESAQNTDTAMNADLPGATVSWAQFYDKFPDNAPGNVVGFLQALTGEPISEFNTEDKLLKHLGKLIGPDQPLRGAVVDYSAKTIITKKKQVPITVVDFTTVPQTKGDIAGKRSTLGPYVHTAE